VAETILAHPATATWAAPGPARFVRDLHRRPCPSRAGPRPS